MTSSDTASLQDKGIGGSVEKRDYLVFALDCARPHERPWHLGLAGVDEVVIGRGPERSVRHLDRTVVVTIPDPSVSSMHVRMRRAGDGWSIEDSDSKNGTRVNGTCIVRSTFGARDLVEIGQTFCILRQSDREPEDGELERRQVGMRTLSAPLARSFELLRRVAASPVPVLLLGETGTGKEVLARAVHELSRRPGPFVAVNCGGLPETLVASELFGARKGAFSGAQADRSGLIEEANRGTLFLDEIAELPEPSQAVLLRVLQERELSPLGSTRTIPVDIRVVAATHQDLAERVATRRFRKDLYARLRGFSFTLPPVRDRREDIGLLIADLLPRLTSGAPGAVVFSRDAARALLSYDWPLNVRELEHTLAAAIAIAPDGGPISLEHLPEELRGAIDGCGSVLGDREDERFAALAQQHGGNVSAMARASGTSRSHIRRLARRYRVDVDAVRESASTPVATPRSERPTS